MNLRDVEVGSLEGKRKAKQAVCDCGGETFIVFQIEGHNHFHLQCDQCGSSFCPQAGACRNDEGEYRDLRRT